MKTQIYVAPAVRDACMTGEAARRSNKASRPLLYTGLPQRLLMHNPLLCSLEPQGLAAWWLNCESFQAHQ